MKGRDTANGPGTHLGWLEGKTLAFLGDSITIDPKGNYVGLVVDGLADYVDASRLTIVNAGVNGSSVLDALDRLPDVLEQDPDLFVVLLGINDSKIFHHIEVPLLGPDVFREAYERLLSRMDAERKRKKVIVTPPPLLFEEIRSGEYLEGYWYWTPQLYDEYVNAVRELAATQRCGLADAYKAFLGHHARRLFGPDGVHPNIYGHRLIAGCVLAALASVGQACS